MAHSEHRLCQAEKSSLHMNDFDSAWTAYGPGFFGHHRSHAARVQVVISLTITTSSSFKIDELKPQHRYRQSRPSTIVAAHGAWIHGVLMHASRRFCRCSLFTAASSSWPSRAHASAGCGTGPSKVPVGCCGMGEFVVHIACHSYTRLLVPTGTGRSTTTRPNFSQSASPTR